MPVCSRETKVTEQSSPEELSSGRGGGGGDAAPPHCRVSVLRDGHREGRGWEPSLTPGEALFRRLEEGANSVKETRKSGWRAGRRAKMAESSSPLTCAGPRKTHPWLLPHSLPSVYTLSLSCKASGLIKLTFMHIPTIPLSLLPANSCPNHPSGPG